ncbi:hypothetical protein [Roseinatronobacter sp.]
MRILAPILLALSCLITPAAAGQVFTAQPSAQQLQDAPVIDVQGGMFGLMAAGYTPERPTRAQGCTIC